MIQLLCWVFLAWFSCYVEFFSRDSPVMLSFSRVIQLLCWVFLAWFSCCVEFFSRDSAVTCWVFLAWLCCYVKFFSRYSPVMLSLSRVTQLLCRVSLAWFSCYVELVSRDSPVMLSFSLVIQLLWIKKRLNANLHFIAKTGLCETGLLNEFFSSCCWIVITERPNNTTFLKFDRHCFYHLKCMIVN